MNTGHFTQVGALLLHLVEWWPLTLRVPSAGRVGFYAQGRMRHRKVHARAAGLRQRLQRRGRDRRVLLLASCESTSPSLIEPRRTLTLFYFHKGNYQGAFEQNVKV